MVAGFHRALPSTALNKSNDIIYLVIEDTLPSRSIIRQSFFVKIPNKYGTD